MNEYINNCITFPCIGKRPCTTKWNTLTKSVPKKKENPNYGILCGKINDLIVIDCDLLKSKESSDKYLCGVKAWNILCDQFSVLKSMNIPTVQTKSGGLHLYFKYNNYLASGVQKLASSLFEEDTNKIVKIDILSDNKFVVGPGSIGYKFINNSGLSTPVHMPSFLIDMLVPSLAASKEESKSCLITTTSNNDVNEDTLSHILDGIPDCYADNYEDWIRIIWAIAETGNKNGFNALHLADQFSQRSDKYTDLKDVEKVYRQSNGKVTFGTLVHLSRNKPIRNQIIKQNESGSDLKIVNTEILIDDFKVFKTFENIDQIIDIKEKGDTRIFSVHTTDGQEKDIEVTQSNMIASSTEESTSKNTERKSLGYLQNSVDIQYDLSVIHPEFGEDSKCILKDLETIDFVHRSDKGGEHRIRIKHPWDKKRSYITKHSHDKQMGNMNRNKQAVDVLLNDALKPGCYQIFKDRYNITVNCQTANFNYFGDDKDKKIRSEEQLINDLIEAHPGIVDSIKFSDNSKLGSFDGLFVCSSITGIWKKEHNGRVEKMLSSRFKKHVPNLNEHEIKFIETHSNIQSLRKMFVKEIIDDDFENNIDENLNNFATSNGVFDFTTKSLRRTLPMDYAMTNCGWKYDVDLAATHIDDVKLFFNKLFPIKTEKDIFLTFIASLLHGYRLDKKFMILTDKRDGNNGKSTLLNLLRVFFGDYLKSSTKFICKASFDKDKDSHDGGLEPLKGKRVMLADELKKNMKLDEGLIKNLAGGKYVVEGRRFGKVDQFKFTWQAGIIMVFNEGDCPKFDSTDKAFMERMLVCPMRSKFINCANDNVETNTYIIDPQIDENFANWRSSLLDYLKDYCNIDGLCKFNIPKSMCEWKEDIISGNNELADWIFENVEVTNQIEDVVSLNDLKDKYKNHYGLRGISDRDFMAIAKALFTSKGFEIKDRHRIRIGGKQIEKRNTIVRIKLIDDIEV
ncbi:MAG: PriCT-2 domain-containing protein [Cetobacterium sp.]